MLRSQVDEQRRQRAPERLQFDLLCEVDLPDSPVLCILVRRDERIVVVVNAVHGRTGHLHAAYHTQHWPGWEQQVCQLGEPCGYEAEVT